MPLISEMPRRRDEVETFQASSAVCVKSQETGVRAVAEKDQERRYAEDDFEEFDQDECVDSDMEGSILHRPRPKKVVKAPPVLPQRSEKRTSRILDNVMLELKNMDGSRTKEEDGMSRLEEDDPHELYLSSEEDASLSDDYEDSESLLDFDGTFSEDEEEGSSSRASSRRSQEITATVVSFKVVSRPQIIEIIIPSSHTSPVTPATETEKHHSMHLTSEAPITKAPSPAPSQLRPAMRRPPPLNLREARPMSVATTGFYNTSYTPTMPTNASMINLSTTSTLSHPQRKSSRLASLVTSTKTSLSSRTFSASATSTHSFLDSDPFAQAASHSNPPLTPTDLSTSITPKTPTSTPSSAWKKSLSRTLSKARKPSLQKLNLAYNTSLSHTTQRSSTMSIATMPTLTRITSNPEPTTPRLLGPSNDTKDTDGNGEAEISVRRAETMPVTPSSREAPVRYEDIMRTAIRAPPPIPLSESMPREGRKSFSLGLGRRKSLKGR